MNTVLGKLKANIWWILLIIGIAGVVYIYFFQNTSSNDGATASYYVVDTVDRGAVTTGIETTGEIVAAQKLDLDVYKQTSRIEAVNIANGGHVEAGDVILSFDKSDAYVDVQAAQVKVAEAKLALNEQEANYTDPNTTERSLRNDISNLEIAIAQAKLDKEQAYRDFLNADLEAESGNTKTKDKVGPTISGLYTAAATGEYRLTVYGSGTASGYSYRVTGLSSDIQELIPGIATPLGNSGLKVTFANNANVQKGDEWVIAVPNVYNAVYVTNKETYDEAITNLDKTIASDEVDLANKQQDLEDLLMTDSTDYRDLNVEQAKATLSQAQVQLSQNYDVVQEQDIVAPFSGSVDGFENVVVGAIPTRDTNDPISLGTLISDDFLVTFSLGAVDVAKVEVGQKVLVNITSFPNVPALTAAITQISSLPDSSGVAQYEVQALIDIPKDQNIELREGLLADVEIVEQEVTDVVRVPSSAITYSQGKATVQVVDTLSPEQQAQVDKLGILKIDAGGTLPSYPVTITTGLSGAFYVEAKNGLDAGTLIVVSSETGSDSSAVVQSNFGPGSGARRNAEAEN